MKSIIEWGRSIQMMVLHNEIFKAFRMVRDHFTQSKFLSVKLRLLERRQRDGVQYSAPSYSKIADLIVHDLG